MKLLSIAAAVAISLPKVNAFGVARRALSTPTLGMSSGTTEATNDAVDTSTINEITDLSDIRFNKCPRLSDVSKEDYDAVFPLKATDYPLMGEKGAFVRKSTDADAVVIAGDFQLYTAQYWSEDPLTEADITPHYPGDKYGKFWKELEAVVEAREARTEGVPPCNLNTWPKIWADKTTLNEVAEAVNGEYPGSIQATFIETVYKANPKETRIQRELGQPFRSFNDFIGNQVRMGALNTWAFEAVAPVNFMLKWNYGVPRPEEMAWKIKNQDLDGVPKDLETKIRCLDNFCTQEQFTAYGPGSPTHPAFPAMHSAGSTVSLWLPALYKITGEQYLEALRVDYAVSFGRTVAGVHYQQDNLAGLNIGQRIIREQLPKHVAENYGYDATKVAERLNYLSFDWNTFDSEEGTIDEMPVAEILENFNKRFPEP